MAHRKAGGTARNLKDSQPKYLGVKLYAGQKAQKGSVIVRQRGSRMLAGKNVGVGKDFTLFSLAEGIVSFRDVRKERFDGTHKKRKMVEVL